MKEIIQKQEELIKQQEELIKFIYGFIDADIKVHHRAEEMCKSLAEIHVELALLQEQDKPISDEAIEEWAKKDTQDCTDPFVRDLIVIKKIEGAKSMRDGLIPPKDNDR